MRTGAWKTRARGGLRRSVRALTAGVLCTLLIDLPLSAEIAPAVSGVPPEIRHGGIQDQMQGEQRILHALNRLTFGPKPGEVAEVKRIGLKRWFEAQLNPQTIDDSALETRLAEFPAMQLHQAELIQRFPDPQMLRAVVDQNAPLPNDPVEHAIYADGIAFYKQAQAAKAAAQTDTAKGADQKNTQQRDPNRGRLTHDESAFPEAETLEILALPPDARVRRILALEPAQLLNFRRSLSREELTEVGRDLTPQQKEIFASLRGSVRMVGAEVLQSRIERDVYSNRQIEAVMTDFWLNHFNVYIRKNQNEPYLLPAYERDTIRAHALGRFEDLLVATAKSPAMLVYLDNSQSIGPDSDAAHRGQRFAGVARNPQAKQALKDRGLNENYARELMELHTLGVGCEVSKDHTASELDPGCGRGYTQADVTEVAKVFSGWTIDRPIEGGEYKFEERRHEPGSKTVIGQKIPENGEKEGLEVLHMLAMSPATARFLSTKLAARFVSDTPPPALIDRMTSAYLSSGGEIRAVLRTMFDSPEFWSPEVYRAKIKTPLEFVASALRATDADITDAVPVVQALGRLGMPLYGMQTPNGYSWMSESWVSTGALVSRMNFALVLSADKLPGTRTDGALLLDTGRTGAQPVSAHPVSMPSDGGASPPAAEERRLEQILLGSPVSERTREAVLAQSADTSVPREAEHDFLQRDDNASSAKPSPTTQRAATESQAATMAGLLLGSPEFQRR